MRTMEADEEIERALRYLVHSFESSGDNPKPVILHSTRVAMDLYDRRYDRHVVVAGFLHDLIEDTDVTGDEIRSRFGDDVADVVEAASFDETIDDYLERHYDIYRRCFDHGRSAVLVKAADLLDNSDYYGVGDDEELQANLIEKLEHFVDESEPYIGEEDLHEELQETVPVVKERVGLRDR
jgi:(p)ppGpp synthase/HD superfamily hydrolase